MDERTELTKLGQLLNDVMMNPDVDNSIPIRRINDAVYDMARKLANVSAEDVADENMENDPRVLHYWTLTSALFTKVYLEAAQQLHYVKEWM